MLRVCANRLTVLDVRLLVGSIYQVIHHGYKTMKFHVPSCDLPVDGHAVIDDGICKLQFMETKKCGKVEVCEEELRWRKGTFYN